MNDWPNIATKDLDRIALLMRVGDGVGVQLGPKSGIVDVECDSEEAEQNLIELLGGQEIVTPTFQSVRGKHRLFLFSDDWPTEKAVFKFKGIEFRIGTEKACQSVFPPSPGRKWIIGPDTPVAKFPALEAVKAGIARAVEPNKPSHTLVDHTDKIERAAAYLSTMDAAISGQNGHNALLRVCTAMAVGFDLDADTAFNLIATEYNPRCVPPWDEKDLRRKIDQAIKHEGATMARGQLLTKCPTFNHSQHVDLSGILGQQHEHRDSNHDRMIDLLAELAEGDHFIGHYIRYVESSAPSPQLIFATAGALACAGAILGRKVKDPYGTRTNVQVLIVGGPSSGKDFQRELNNRLLNESGTSGFYSQKIQQATQRSFAILSIIHPDCFRLMSLATS